MHSKGVLYCTLLQQYCSCSILLLICILRNTKVLFLFFKFSEKRPTKWEVGHRHSNIEEKSDNDGDDDQKSDNQCHKQAVLYGTGIRGGKTAGIFNDVGDMLTIDACVRRCCQASRCDVAYMEKGRCYNVICHFPSLCQPVTSDSKPVTLGYVMRDGRSVYQPGMELKTWLFNLGV